MNNTKDEKINLGKEYDNEKQDSKSTTNDMNISSEIVQIVAKSADSDNEEDRKSNKMVDNSVRLQNKEYTTKEEQWIIPRKIVKQTTVIKKKKEKTVVHNRFHGFNDSDNEEDCQSNSIVVKTKEKKDSYKYLLFSRGRYKYNRNEIQC